MDKTVIVVFVLLLLVPELRVEEAGKRDGVREEEEEEERLLFILIVNSYIYSLCIGQPEKYSLHSRAPKKFFSNMILENPK